MGGSQDIALEVVIKVLIIMVAIFRRIVGRKRWLMREPWVQSTIKWTVRSIGKITLLSNSNNFTFI